MDGELIDIGGIKTNSVMKQFMDEVITLITDANGIITFIHSEYTRTLGISAEDAIGKHCLEVIPGSRMHIVAKTGKKEIGVPFRMKNGEYAVINRLPVFEDGKVIAIPVMPQFRAGRARSDSFAPGFAKLPDPAEVQTRRRRQHSHAGGGHAAPPFCRFSSKA